MSEELARRAVACDGWRWMLGMLTTGGERVVDIEKVGSDERDGIPWAIDLYYTGPHELFDNPRHAPWVPDLTDAATIGCLLALVREAWGDKCAHIRGSKRDGGSLWRPLIEGPDGRLTSVRSGVPSEAEALVDALEAAPKD